MIMRNCDHIVVSRPKLLSTPEREHESAVDATLAANRKKLGSLQPASEDLRTEPGEYRVTEPYKRDLAGIYGEKLRILSTDDPRYANLALLNRPRPCDCFVVYIKAGRPQFAKVRRVTIEKTSKR